MRIVLVTNAGGDGRVQYGGAEAAISNLCPALRDRGHDVTVVCPRGRLYDELASAGVPLREAGPRRYLDPAYVSELRSIIKASSPDVVTLQLQSAAMHGRLALPYRGFPNLVALHNNLQDILQGEKRRGARARVRIAMAVDRVLSATQRSRYVAVSDLDLRLLTAHGRKAVLVRNSLPQTWPQPPTASEIAARAQRIGYLGRYEYQKGYDHFLELARACPDLEFVSCGKGEMGGAVPGNVRDLGETHDPAAYLRTLDVLVVPSRWEIFGRVAVEAQSQGAHVLHSGVGGLGEHDPAAINSTAVSPWTTEAAAPALRQILAAPKPAEARAQWAHEVAQKHSFDAAVTAWERALAATAAASDE